MHHSRGDVLPELPEVEKFRRYSRKAFNKQVVSVSIAAPEIMGCSQSTLRKHLLHNRLIGAERRGKWLFLEISDGFFLVLHFGMSGNLHYYKGEQPDHTALDLELKDGYHLAFVCVRKFGGFDIIDSVDRFIKKKELGPDALTVSKKRFVELMESRSGHVKTALMDQSLLAGIGNIYSDEILYQEHLSPRTELEELDEKDLESIHSAMQRILKTSISNSSDFSKIPSRYLLGRRSPGEDCGICDGKIKTVKVGGRTAYYCPEHQR